MKMRTYLVILTVLAIAGSVLLLAGAADAKPNVPCLVGHSYYSGCVIPCVPTKGTYCECAPECPPPPQPNGGA